MFAHHNLDGSVKFALGNWQKEVKANNILNLAGLGI